MMREEVEHSRRKISLFFSDIAENGFSGTFVQQPTAKIANIVKIKNASIHHKQLKNPTLYLRHDLYVVKGALLKNC